MPAFDLPTLPFPRDTYKTPYIASPDNSGYYTIAAGQWFKNAAGLWVPVSAENPLPTIAELSGSIVAKTVTIPSGATGLSNPVDLTGIQIQQLQMPATWVNAVLTLQTSDAEDGTYQDLYDDSGIEVALTALQGKNMAVAGNALALAPLSWVKFRSGTGAVPVDQTAERTIKIIGKI